MVLEDLGVLYTWVVNPLTGVTRTSPPGSPMVEGSVGVPTPTRPTPTPSHH